MANRTEAYISPEDQRGSSGWLVAIGWLATASSSSQWSAGHTKMAFGSQIEPRPPRRMSS